MNEVEKLPEKLALVVDDEAVLRQIMKIDLTRRGFKVLVASNGLEAAELLQRYSFELVITDYRMPKASGLVVLNTIHTTTMLKPSVVYLITGYADISDEQAISLGVHRVIEKPVDRNTFLKQLCEDLHCECQGYKSSS